MRFLKNNNSKTDLMINDIDPSQKLIKNLNLKIAGTFLALFVLASCACETANPMMDETFVATNIDIARTITSNADVQIWHQTNFTSSNGENAVVYYNTGGGFTNIFFRYVLASVGLSNYLAETNMEVITTNDVITTNILSNVESSFLMTNISNTSTNVPLAFITNYFTNYVGIAGTNTVTNINWSDFDFSGANLTNLNLTNYNFAGADLNEADLRFANLSNANLSNANLSNANLSSGDLRFASLINANLSSANFTNAWLNGEGYLYLRSQGIDGFEPNLTGADLQNADLIEADLMNANLSNANLSNADLNRAILLGATTNGINFTGADLTAALIDLDKTLAMDGAASDSFGISVSVSGDTVIVGALEDDDNGDASGSAYIFTRTGTDWSQQAKITPNDGATNDNFGFSVSVSGDTVIVGAHNDNDNGNNSGSAYIFTRTGTNWSQQAKITPNDGAASDNFGRSVSVSGDTVIVGALEDDDNGDNSGSAYIFTRTGTDWSQQAKITPNDGAAGDEFGISVSVSGDTAIVGAYFDDDNGSASGSAYIFTRTGTDWSQQAKIKPSDVAAIDNFGVSVSVFGDTVIVGSYLDDDNGTASGSAYVFTRTGTNWSQQAKIKPSDGSANDLFGYSVSVSRDTVIVGAYRDDNNGDNSGSAYIFTRTGTDWSQQAKIKPSDVAAIDNFGVSVSVFGDTVIVGSYLDDDNGTASGSAYVFTRTGTNWSQQAKIKPSDGSANDLFGYSVSVSRDTVIVGAYRDDNNGDNSGSAYIFTRTGSTWAQQANITPNDGAAGDEFGRSVSVSGDTVIVGAFEDDDNGNNSGSAYVFEFGELP